MDCLRRRERRRLLEDLIDLQREEDVQRQYQSIMYNIQGLERSRPDSDEEDDYRNDQQRRKEYCLVKVIYRNSNIRRRKKVDEIMILRNNRIVFKGCLKDGDQLIFKSQRYRNESKVKLKFYINDLPEEEVIACCEHGLIDRNRPKHLFQIEKVMGGKPCYDCEFDDDTSETSSRNSRDNSFRKNKIPPSIIRSSSVLSEEQSDEEKPKEKKSTLLLPQITNNKASSEGFSADITELADYPSELRNRSNNQLQSDEDSTDVVPSIRPPSLKRTYGPPQLSITESLDPPTPNIREPTPSGLLFNSGANTQQRSVVSQTSQNESNLSSMSTQDRSQSSSTVEITANEQETSFSLTTSNDMGMTNDATELLLARLGITRQEQVERPQVAHIISPREKGNVEYFLLIYLHHSYPDESVVKHLRSLVNYFKVFDDGDDCLAFINTVINEKIILILSHSFRDSVLPRITELQQIFTIYILTENENQLDLPPGKSKVQGCYTNIDNIFERISNDVKKISRDLVTYLNVSSAAISIDTTIVYFTLLSELILESTETKNDLKELIYFARQEYEGNEEELKIIDEFESKYQKNQAIYWFSRPCFISKMINKGLRIPEPDILYRLGVFIRDLHQQIQHESTSESITVYLGQTIERNDLDDLQKNILTNDIVIFPQFLFGSTDQERAIRIAREIPLVTEDAIPLIIRIDISEDFKCANLNTQRYSIDEDNNVLLNMGIIGRLVKVEKENIHEDQIASVHLRLVKSEEQQNMQQILQIKRTEVKSFSSFAGIIKLMIQINQLASAEQLVQTMFDDEILQSDDIFQGSIAASCHVLAQSRRNQEDNKRALDLYLLAMKAFLRIISPNAVELSVLYSNIGSTYFRLEDYEKSLEYYQRALDNQVHSTTPDLYSVSSFTNSIGVIYSKQKNYPEAIKSFERTLKILHLCTEPHDAELAANYDDLGDTYLSQLKYDEALENYSKAIEVHERIVPRNPQALGNSYHTIGSIYMKLGRSKNALTNLKRGLECFQEVLPITHATFALLYNNIGLMHYREEEYPDALSYYSKGLESSAISLPETHPLVGVILFNIALIYSRQEKFDEASEMIEKSTAQFLKTLPPDHSDVLDNEKFLESLRHKKALKDIFDENTISF